MKERTTQREKVSRTLDANPKTSQQVSMNIVLQEKRISLKQIKEVLGCAGPYAGNTWQWNDINTGIHVTLRRDGKYVTHFHVRKDTTGAVYNRIDYNENGAGNWVESDVNVPAGTVLRDQMREIARQTIKLIRDLIPPTD